jgi:SAM-dependent methyltransferase
MAASQFSGTGSASPTGPVAPAYVPGPKRGSVIARFPGGAEVPVDLSRTRAYPGLRTQAPSMAAFYDALASLAPRGRVLDAGSGSGSGARRLEQAGFRVTAVEIDPNAVAFAERYAPGLEHVTGSVADLDPARRFDAAISADLLGHVLDPELVCAAIGRALEPGAPFLVAESAAHVSQRLSAPQRRSFSVARLRALLVRAGFSVEAVICDSVPFVALLGRASSVNVCEAFSSAYQLAGRGRIDQAIEALEGARGTNRLDVEIEVLLARSELYLAQGAGDAAAQACFRARELAPTDARPLVGLGRIALASGATADALHLALDAIECDATEALACALAAYAADSLGHPDAFTAWRAATNLAPDDINLACQFARSASGRGDHGLGLQNLERVERYGQPEPAYHLTRAWLLLAAGRKHEAAIEARIAEARGGNPEELACLRAEVGKT